MSTPFGTSYVHTEPNGGRDAPNYGKPWTLDEKTDLYRLFQSGYSLKAMCSKLGRPASGILSKLEAADLICRKPTGYWRTEQRKVINPCAEIDLPVKSTTYVFKEPITFKEEPTMSSIKIAHLEQHPVIETRTFIDGSDGAYMADEAIFNRIAQLEDAIKKLELISNKPKKLLAQIEKHKQDITALVTYVDSRS